MAQDEARERAATSGAGETAPKNQAASQTPARSASDAMAIGSPDAGQPAHRFWATWQDLSSVYEHYARLQGLSYTSLTVIDEVYRRHLAGTDCTQKSICAATFLPKQTANSVIAGFVRDGLVELTELPHDRRAKAVRLTERGLAYARRIIDPIDAAESAAFAQLTDAEREQFLTTMEHYAASCAARLSAFEQTQPTDEH